MRTYKQHASTKFEREYGEHRNDFAAKESVLPATISMRIHKFGSPYMRRAKATFYERKYARTLYEIAEERQLHPITIIHHERNNNDAYFVHPTGRGGRPSNTGVWRKAVQTGKYWRCQCAFLHPLHPDYTAWRAGKLFPDEYVGGSKITEAQVETMMRGFDWKKY